jgi:hypothetical protein
MPNVRTYEDHHHKHIIRLLPFRWKVQAKFPMHPYFDIPTSFYEKSDRWKYIRASASKIQTKVPDGVRIEETRLDEFLKEKACRTKPDNHLCITIAPH